ncbi:MAG: D-glycero-beta-D-manno-heptose 1,7-bisphosphate 7-phosphatase [Gammaproteobacteria bacterium]|nr:D-glycero-beta-D-manno-heptose 1,7-bisphosphate 7-phosphatase [Gammaproteobacteria bacterium]
MNANLLILDRDGVINADSPDHIKSESEWKALPGSLGAISRANRAGYRVVILSNQSALGRGFMTIEDLNAIHQKLVLHLSQFGGNIEAFFFCPHKPDDNCTCRKPGTGLYRELAHRLGANVSGVPSIGDKLSDIEAAQAAGARPVLVRTGNGRDLEKSGKLPAGVPVHDDLRAAVEALLTESGARPGSDPAQY